VCVLVYDFDDEDDDDDDNNNKPYSRHCCPSDLCVLSAESMLLFKIHGHAHIAVVARFVSDE